MTEVLNQGVGVLLCWVSCCFSARHPQHHGGCGGGGAVPGGRDDGYLMGSVPLVEALWRATALCGRCSRGVLHPTIVWQDEGDYYGSDFVSKLICSKCRNWQPYDRRYGLVELLGETERDSLHYEAALLSSVDDAGGGPTTHLDAFRAAMENKRRLLSSGRRVEIPLERTSLKAALRYLSLIAQRARTVVLTAHSRLDDNSLCEDDEEASGVQDGDGDAKEGETTSSSAGAGWVDTDDVPFHNATTGTTTTTTALPPFSNAALLVGGFLVPNAAPYAVGGEQSPRRRGDYRQQQQQQQQQEPSDPPIVLTLLRRLLNQRVDDGDGVVMDNDRETRSHGSGGGDAATGSAPSVAVSSSSIRLSIIAVGEGDLPISYRDPRHAWLPSALLRSSSTWTETTSSSSTTTRLSSSSSSSLMSRAESLTISGFDFEGLDWLCDHDDDDDGSGRDRCSWPLLNRLKVTCASFDDPEHLIRTDLSSSLSSSDAPATPLHSHPWRTPQLVDINFSMTNIRSLEWVKWFPLLRRLSMAGCAIHDGHLASLTAAPLLEHLDLTSTHITTVEPIRSALPQLTNLNVGATRIVCASSPDATTSSASPSSPHSSSSWAALESISFDGCRLLSSLHDTLPDQTRGRSGGGGAPVDEDSSTSHWLSSCRSLKRLSLVRCISLTYCGLWYCGEPSSADDSEAARLEYRARDLPPPPPGLVDLDLSFSSVSVIKSLILPIVVGANGCSLQQPTYGGGPLDTEAAAPSAVPRYLPLRRLILRGCPLRADVVEGLERLPCLEELDLGATRISKIKSLATAPRLRRLLLDSTAVSNAEVNGLAAACNDRGASCALSSMGSGSRLEELSLASTRVSDVSDLARLPRLTRLNLEATRVSSHCVSALDAAPALMELRLRGSVAGKDMVWFRNASEHLKFIVTR